MSVFLRWGIFGILAVAGLIYAYNASKKLAENRMKEPPAAVQATASEPEAEAESETETESRSESGPPVTTPPHCEAELVVAQRALQARRAGEPLDRLLRIPEIAWQEPPARRERLVTVATEWFNYEGEEPVPEALRSGVISNCVRLSPAP